MRPQEYAKAIVGGILAGLAVLGTALVDDVVTAAEWVGVAVATLTVFSSVFGIPNAAKKDTVASQKVTVETTQVDAASVPVTDPIALAQAGSSVDGL